jgi:hypothetical protein
VDYLGREREHNSQLLSAVRIFDFGMGVILLFLAVDFYQTQLGGIASGR